MKIIILQILVLLTFASYSHAVIVSSDSFSAVGSSTITTTVDDELRIVTYRLDGLKPIFEGFKNDLDIHLDTAIASSIIESDQTTLITLQPHLGGPVFHTGGSIKSGFFATIPELGVESGEFSGLFAFAGVDESTAKRDPYIFGLVYDEAYIFTGNFNISTLQINSQDYQFATPELALVPIPAVGLLFMSGFLMLFQIRKSSFNL